MTIAVFAAAALIAVAVAWLIGSVVRGRPMRHQSDAARRLSSLRQGTGRNFAGKTFGSARNLLSLAIIDASER
jgi:hypothetical protein